MYTHDSSFIEMAAILLFVYRNGIDMYFSFVDYRIDSIVRLSYGFDCSIIDIASKSDIVQAYPSLRVRHGTSSPVHKTLLKTTDISYRYTWYMEHVRSSRAELCNPGPQGLQPADPRVASHRFTPSAEKIRLRASSQNYKEYPGLGVIDRSFTPTV